MLIVLVGLVLITALAMDHSLVVGPEACIDCHSPEHDVWAETTHFKTYEELSISDAALEIADALGIDDIEDPSGTCVGCHFTLTGETADEAEPIAGISCESCHGAAADWIDGHGLYPGDGPESESADQKQARIAEAEGAGQIRPERVNLIAANCMECHTVPDETLVNKGGHVAGSAIELVSWLDGEVRHNLFWSNGEDNVSSSPERKRELYVVGLAADLEFSLRGLAKSEVEGNYRSAMADRVKAAAAGLAAAGGAASSPALSQLATIAAAVDAGSHDPGAYNSAADQLAAASRAYVTSGEGRALSGLDALIPGEGHYSEKY